MCEKTNREPSDIRKRYWQEHGKPPEGEGPHPDRGGPAYIPWLEALVTQLDAKIASYRNAYEQAVEAASQGWNVSLPDLDDMLAWIEGKRTSEPSKSPDPIPELPPSDEGELLEMYEKKKR